MKTVGCETWKPMVHVECLRRGVAWAWNRRVCQTPQRFHNQYHLVFKCKHNLPVFKFRKHTLPVLMFHNQYHLVFKCKHNLLVFKFGKHTLPVFRFHNQHHLVFKFGKHTLPVFRFHNQHHLVFKFRKQHLVLAFHLARQVCKRSNRSWAKYHSEQLATSLWSCVKMWSDFQVVPRFRSCHELPVILSCHGQMSLVPPRNMFASFCRSAVLPQRWHVAFTWGGFRQIEVIHLIQVIYHMLLWQFVFLVKTCSDWTRTGLPIILSVHCSWKSWNLSLMERSHQFLMQVMRVKKSRSVLGDIMKSWDKSNWCHVNPRRIWMIPAILSPDFSSIPLTQWFCQNWLTLLAFETLSCLHTLFEAIVRPDMADSQNEFMYACMYMPSCQKCGNRSPSKHIVLLCGFGNFAPIFSSP